MDGSSALVIVTTIVDGSFFGALGAGILYIMLKKHSLHGWHLEELWRQLYQLYLLYG